MLGAQDMTPPGNCISLWDKELVFDRGSYLEDSSPGWPGYSSDV